ncbi:tRNA (adenine(22)-N(1))-methyltransferase [Paenibacillus crassostreae]|uniref:SAM-dependent methyltransferase n=1 Tax=Paenibacillus crassostreae TaxID=1763538 RepID=A0A162RKL7_9BACL|nr:tRNA (adenine(22)-N(1))-methyltransferase TrmK [Paenibacillus crassostreae]AOZ91711.1 tRNA (adenine-N(1))-methyltransferase [Paenibacillus crassostreae]OAB72717.1 SAM-dependent methyltransferase [Paenibacillus crassostreae]
MKLSKRLQYIMEQIPDGSTMADIGSDHAMLPVAAVQKGKVLSAIAGEVNPGPRDAAAKQVASAGLIDKISVRLGDGLNVIEPGEVDVITIAGMGGGLISSILEQGISKLQGVKMLVLQPNVGEDLVRRWLLDNRWILISEHIMEEDRKVYEILTAVPKNNGETLLSNDDVYKEYFLNNSKGSVKVDQDMMIRLGPWLLKGNNPIFIAKWMSELDKLDRVLKSLATSSLPSAEVKSEVITQEIRQIKEVLSCLQKDKL